MFWARRTGLLLILAATLTACARPATWPADPPQPPAPIERAPDQAAPPSKLVPAQVTVEYRFGEVWKPLSLMASHVPPGGAEVRISFSKPVRRGDVEKALQENQLGPIRGLMQWQDDQTLYWQIAQLPARLDFLLSGASDLDGVPLPGGIPSIRVGEPPRLVEVDLSKGVEQVRAELPPDLLTASLTADGSYMNLLSWIPGSNRWDWQTRESSIALGTGSMHPWRAQATDPRIPDDLEAWVVSPAGTLVAGLKTEQRSPPDENPYRADLVVLDLRGGRRAVFERFVGRYLGTAHIDLSTYLAWTADGSQVAALNYTAPDRRGSSDLVSLNVSTGAMTVLAKEIPVAPYGARLAWSPGGRFMLAGNLLLDLEARSHRVLPGTRLARGIWEPGGNRLLYSPEDWGPIYVVEAATGTVTPLGDGLLVDWASAGKVYVVRWPSSPSRFQPPGM